MASPLWRLAGALFAMLPLAGRSGEASGTPPLTARIMPTVQYAHADIYYRTPPGEGPSFTLTRELVADQRLDLLVMAQGASSDAAGKVNVVYDLRVLAPNGSVVEDSRDLRLAVDRAVPAQITPAQMVLFPTDVAALVVKTGEPMGEYRIEVTVRDRVAGTTATASQTVTASADNAPLPWPESKDVNLWWTTYYLNPQPRLFVSALVELSRKPELRNRPPEGQGALLGFTDQVLKDNPWLVPQVLAQVKRTDDEWEKRILSMVLASALRDRPGELENLLKDVVKRLPQESKEPLAGAQLDLWWGQFMGGGRFQPVLELVQLGERYQVYRPAYDAYAARPEPRGAATLDERRGALHATALWSLGSNARQHKRVMHYLVGLKQAPGTDAATKAVVDAALADPPPARAGARTR